ncbi:hypothetical protein [Actinoplanes nipponensis]|uniref:hypothetical protein n=1 Tax=Actinoplanes nipponensis TaxID=135950 RepID=UPI0031E86F77
MTSSSIQYARARRVTVPPYVIVVFSAEVGDCRSKNAPKRPIVRKARGERHSGRRSTIRLVPSARTTWIRVASQPP